MVLKKSFDFFTLVLPFALMACGDDVTKVYENPGMAVLESGEKLSGKTCDSSMVGEMLFVMDSSAAFICDGKSWGSLKGADGKNGTDSKSESGKNGTSCSAEKVTKGDRSGVEISCGNEVVDTLWNGVDGEDGKDAKAQNGKDGASCSAAKVTKDDRSGIEITCDNEVVDTLWNGVDGQKGKDGEDGVGTPGEPGEPGKDGAGCKIVTGRSNEIMVIVCGEGDAADTARLEMCNNKIYDSMHSFCDSRDYQIYKFVTIGTQTWMAQNMNYEAEGSVVGNVNLAVYGRLYAKDNMEKVCPSGWHLPVKEEWDLLFETVGDNYYRELTADSGWGGDQGLDSYGLALTPAGWCNLSGSTCYGDGSLFSYRPKGEDHVYQLSPTFNRPRDDDYKASVRCVRD